VEWWNVGRAARDSNPTPLQRWRSGNGPHLVALVRTGARFECGRLIERVPEGPSIATKAA